MSPQAPALPRIGPVSHADGDPVEPIWAKRLSDRLEKIEGHLASQDAPNVTPWAATARLCVELVSGRTGIEVSLILSDQRHREVAFARLVAYWLAREVTGLSLPQIGRAIGGRDHTTVLKGAQAIAALRLENPKVRELTNGLRALFRKSFR